MRAHAHMLVAVLLTRPLITKRHETQWLTTMRYHACCDSRSGESQWTKPTIRMSTPFAMEIWLWFTSAGTLG